MNNYFIFFWSYLLLSFQLSAQNPLAVDQIDETLLKNANAVVRYSNTDIHLKERDKVTYKFDEAITVLNEKEKEALDVILFYSKSTKVKKISIEYLDKNGEIIKKVSKSDLRNYAAGDGFSLITDNRVKYYNYTPKEYPVTIRTSLLYEAKTTAWLPGWNPYSGYKVSVEKSSYKLTASEGMEILRKEVNLESLPSLEKDGYSYTVHSLPAFKKEPYSPPLDEILPKVIFVPVEFSYEGYEGRARNWDEFGRFNYKSFIKPNAFSEPSDVKREIDPYLGEAETQEDTIAAVYDFVQENTRYISIQLNEGGWKPMDLDKVHELKYGDCKALSNYTRAILDLYRIPADYVIVEASRTKSSFYDDFASGSQGNHIIVRVPQDQKDDIWLECTSNDSPFNFLGSFTDDRKVLVVNQDTNYIVKTPSYADKNKRHFKSTVDLTQSDVSKVHSEISNIGIQYYQGLRRSKMDDKERTKQLHKKLFKFIDVTKVSSSNYRFDEDDFLSQETYELEAKDCAERVGEYLLLPVGFHELNIPKLSTKRKRTREIEFSRTYHNVIETTYILPEGYKADISTEVVEDKNLYCTYSKVMKQEGAKLTITREFKLYENRYAPEKYLNIAKVFKKLRKEESQKIKIKPSKT